MTKSNSRDAVIKIKELFGAHDQLIREGLQGWLQQILESEMTEALGAAKSERTEGGAAAQHAVPIVEVSGLPADVGLTIYCRTASEHVSLGDFGAAPRKMLLRQREETGDEL